MRYDLRTPLTDIVCGIVVVSSLSGVALGALTRDAVLTYVHKSDECARTLENPSENSDTPIYEAPQTIQHSPDSVDSLVDNEPVQEKFDGSKNTAPASYRRD